MGKRHLICSFSILFFSLSLWIGASAGLQTLEGIVKTPSPTGYEEKMIQEILKLLPDGLRTEQDGLGSLYAARERDEECLALVTGIDEIGYIISGFDERGYLHLDRVVTAPHGLYDSFQFGHPMTVWTEEGPVSGVLALPSLHIASRDLRRELQNLFVIENALVDIGAGSIEEAKHRGVAMLDPVTPLARITNLARQQMSGPSLGTKVCTAFLVELAEEGHPKTLAKPVTFAWLVQTKFPARGLRPRASLGAVVAKEKLAASGYLIFDSFPVNPQSDHGVNIGKGPVLVTGNGENSELEKRIVQLAASENLPLQRMEQAGSMLYNAFVSEDNAAGLFIPVKFPATPNEIVDFKDVEILQKLVSLLLH
jgi:putative aminopeptidase FrvX